MAKNKSKENLLRDGDIDTRQFNIMAASGHRDLKDLANTHDNGTRRGKGPVKYGIEAFKLLRGCGAGCARVFVKLLRRFGWIE